MQFVTVNDQDLNIKRRVFNWPIYLVVTEWKHVIDMHHEIYSINDVCKPKIYILATFDKVIDPSGGYSLPFMPLSFIILFRS